MLKYDVIAQFISLEYGRTQKTENHDWFRYFRGNQPCDLQLIRGAGLAIISASMVQIRTYERCLPREDRIFRGIGASDDFREIGSRVSNFFFYVRGSVFEGLASWFVRDEAGYCSCM
jgi:hypothetical protein